MTHTPTLAASDHFPLGGVCGEFEIASHGRRMTLTEPFVFLDGLTAIDVPAWFVTDFNSVPRPLWVPLPPWMYPEAGVVHDWLYRHPGGRNRGQCDDLHRRVLHLTGCNWFKRQVYWTGIRSGGWKSWNRYREADGR